jgi:hypothetical protein
MLWIQAPSVKPGDPPRPGLIAYRRLTWADFEPRSVLSGASAQTSAVLHATYKWGWKSQGNQFTGFISDVRIGAWFDPAGSWRKADVRSDNALLLEHEQRHFDLCEVGARLLRDQIMLLRPDIHGSSDAEIRIKVQNIMNPLVTSFIDDVKKQQERYDRESNHSRNRRVQQEWNARIQHDLDRLAPISSR